MGDAIHVGRLARWYDVQARFYHAWRDRYDGPLARQAVALVEAPPAAQVLDAACGGGLFAMALARAHPDWRVTGLDYSSGMLAVAARAARRRGVEGVSWVFGRVESLPFPNDSFDAVMLGGVWAVLNHPEAVLAELRRVLRTGGLCLLIEFDGHCLSPGQKAMFRASVAAYRCIAWAAPSVRYAENWSVARSLPDAAVVEAAMEAAGMAVVRRAQAAGHMFLVGRKREA